MQTMTQSYNQSISHSLSRVTLFSLGLSLNKHKDSEQGQSSLISATRAVGVKFLL